MNFYSKLAFSAVLCTTVLAAGAQNLGEGTVVNPYPPHEYQTFLAIVNVSYDFKLITLVNPETMVEVNFGGKDYRVYADIYFDEEVAMEFGQTYKKDWGNKLIIDFSDEAYNANYPVGDYSITIPEGLVMDEAGNTNASQIINFIKVNPVAPLSVTPADGMYPADELNEICVTFKEKISFNPYGGQITIREKNDWLSEPIYVESPIISDDGYTLKFDISNDLERGKVYSINIPELFLILGNYYTNNEIWMEYMNWNGMEPATLISAPETDAAPPVKPFILTWDYQTITMPGNAPDTKFVCGFPDYGWQDGWTMNISASEYKLVNIDKEGNISFEITNDKPANAVYLDVSEFIKDDIGYRFEIFIPAGLVLNKEGLENPPLNYVFTVRNLWIDPEITSENGIIKMIWPFAEIVTYNLSDYDPVLIGESGDQFILNFNFGVPGNGEISLLPYDEKGIAIDLNQLNLQNGNYTLTIPTGYLVLQDETGEFILNDIVIYNFSWLNGDFNSSINSIVTTDNAYFIYDLRGNIINKDISDLRKGIYIINGRKVFIK